ncbi:YceD family protein, partial [Ruminococcus bicirculans (ex Wegman et al. 2014)]|uniref:YceD family protein n=1 Tax=Ruminococcus bicirculans (ex Wegman et al. 2014) TaxID=1160721 RepID=UPI00366DA0C6
GLLYEQGMDLTVAYEHESDRDDYVVCENNTLDLDELAISDLLLQLPTKILCRDDCKGLCYVCGQDLNEGKCNCS